MKQRLKNNISESQVEDALVANVFLIKNFLQFEGDLKLIARQLRLKAGEQKLDLLFLGGRKLYLIELKITKFADSFIEQVSNYRKELLALQDGGELIAGEILSYLFVTESSKNDLELAEKSNIKIINYSPLKVLGEYYKNLTAVALFLRLKPNDYGVFNLGLINRAINQLGNGETKKKQIAQNIDLSENSVKNHLTIAKEFGLVSQRKLNYFLTDLGEEYFLAGRNDALIDKLTDGQIAIVKNVIAKEPFYSSTVFGIYCLVESAFLLARNSYPIKLNELQKMFRIVSGKISEWQMEKTLSTTTYTFLNFAIELELLGKIGKDIVITPAGFRFVLMLQLHKSIKMIDSLTYL